LKRFLSLFIALLMSFGFIACNVETTTTTQTTVTTTQTSSTTSSTTLTTTTEVTTVDNAPEFFGIEDKEIQEGEEIDLLEGITAVDDLDGDVTASITFATDLDPDTIGVYTVTLSVTDSASNTATASFTVTVIQKVLTNEDYALMDISAISLSYPNIVLPRWGSNGTNFYWSTDNPRVITAEGYVINPPVGSDPVDVTLTLRAVKGSYITTKDFVFTVQPNQEVTVTNRIQLDFEGTSEEYIVENKTGIDIFYVDNGTVPYIDIETFLNMIDGAIESEIITYSYPASDILRIDYEIEYLDLDGVTVITESYYAEIDFTENTFTVNNFGFFSGYIASTESDYGEGLNYVDADFRDGQQVVIPLGAYNFDLVIYEEGEETFYLMPLAVTNRLFAGSIYYDVYYNGDKLWGIDTFVINRGEAEIVDMVRTSSFNDKTMAKDMKLATYNFLAFVMDYFYGLKPDKGYETFYTRLNAYAKSIIEGSDQNLYSKVFQIAYGLDDLHTSYIFDGYYQPPRTPGVSISDLGVKTQAFYNYLWNVQDQLTAKFGDYRNLPEYSLIDSDKVAVIHLTGFTIDTPDEFKAILDGLPETVEDIVIDLSYNTGGNIGAVLRIFGYITEERFTYHSQNPADGSAYTYYIESDYVAYDYNWYVLTSGVTFSAANMFASMAKELGIPVIGQNSSGGASSIGVIINPDGSAIMISTNNVLSSRSGNEVDGYVYHSVENGIEVDYFMSNVTSDTQLINIINQIRNQSQE